MGWILPRAGKLIQRLGDSEFVFDAHLRAVGNAFRGSDLADAWDSPPEHMNLLDFIVNLCIY